MFKAKNKRTTNCMKLKFARSIKRKKEQNSKSTTKVLAKIRMSGVTMALYLTSKDFTLCLHLLHLKFITRGALGFPVLRFWLFFRSVFRFLLQKTSVFRFWWSLRFADFSFFSIWFSVFMKNTSGFSVLVPDVIFGFWKGSEVQ